MRVCDISAWITQVSAGVALVTEASSSFDRIFFVGWLLWRKPIRVLAKAPKLGNLSYGTWSRKTVFDMDVACDDVMAD